MKMTETMIKKLEAKGFKRWTKGEHDRLYANVENFAWSCTTTIAVTFPAPP